MCPPTLAFVWENGQDDSRTGKRTGTALANIGYARVSTQDQNLSLQLDALAAAGCERVFEDRMSGARADRAGLQDALRYVRDGEVLVVWKLDRLGRSLPHLIEIVTDLARRGVGFRSLTEAIERPARLPHFRGAGPVRARPDPGAHPRGLGRRRGAGTQRRAQAGRHRRQAPTGAPARREGPDRARGRHAREGQQNGAVRSA